MYCYSIYIGEISLESFGKSNEMVTFVFLYVSAVIQCVLAGDIR